MGVVVALQFGPQMLLLPWTGIAADHFDRRRLIMATQAGLGALAAGLGTLTVLHLVRLWQVNVFALLSGCLSAFAAPASQVFVAELVGDDDLSNAIALNAISYNAARMVGPALAGFVIAGVGCGWAFFINAASFFVVLCSLLLLRVHELRPTGKSVFRRGRLADGLQYVWRRADLTAIVLMVFMLGTFALNFPIFVSTMTVAVFHRGPGEYGLLSSTLAFGTLAGALWSASRRSSGFSHVLAGAVGFGIGCVVAAISPGFTTFCAALIAIGFSTLVFNTSTTTVTQLSTAPEMRGQVMAIYIAVAVAGAPLGAPIIGWAADTIGPRYALGLGCGAGLSAVCVGVWYLIRYHERHGGAPEEQFGGERCSSAEAISETRRSCD